ncbi:MAB_1171c family putative transporter [Streptosporangium sp. NPDC002524]|uniref:MAB_1171c family putative transporter n=1 Tax=Streptosporangium sp. NPDC002524 TaxID=3154537 RepID=UPI0033207F04
MTEAFYWVEVVVIWAIAIQTVRHLTARRRSPADTASLVHVVTLGLGAVAQSPDVRPRLDLLTGVDGLGRWLSFSIILCSMAAFWTVVAYVTHRQAGRPPRVRARLIGVACAIAGMGVTLLGSGTRDDVGASFLAVYGGNALVVCCYAIFLGYIAAVLVDTLRSAWRYKNYARQWYLRVGMHILVVGDICGLVYCLYLGSTVATSYLALPLPPGATTYAATYIGFGAVALILAGPTISVWGPRLTGPFRVAAQRLALRRLHPLWLALTTAMPYLRSRPSHALGDVVGYRLYRRVIEIRDGLLILEPYRDLAAEQRPVADVAADARSIAVALRAFSVGEGGEGGEGDEGGESSKGAEIVEVAESGVGGESEELAGAFTDDDDQLDTNREPGGHDGAVIAPKMPLMKDEVAYLTRLSRAFERFEKES